MCHARIPSLTRVDWKLGASLQMIRLKKEGRLLTKSVSSLKGRAAGDSGLARSNLRATFGYAQVVQTQTGAKFYHKGKIASLFHVDLPKLVRVLLVVPQQQQTGGGFRQNVYGTSPSNQVEQTGTLVARPISVQQQAAFGWMLCCQNDGITSRRDSLTEAFWRHWTNP